MYNVKFFKRAKEQYINIWKYIAEDNLFYANEVLNKIDDSIETILQFPNIWTKIDNTYRKIVEPNYKFKIVYRISKETINIVWIYREQNSWKFFVR